MATTRLSATKIGVGALIALTLSTAVATVVNLQGSRSDSVPTAIATSPASSDPSSSAAVKYAISLIESRNLGTGSTTREKVLADLLPNHKYFVGSEKPRSLASSIVVGDIESVSPVGAYRSDNSNDAGVREVDFDDPGAEWRVVDVTIAVSSALGETTGDSVVHLGLTLEAEVDTDEAIAGYAALGRVIAVLDGPGEISLDPALYSVRQGGGLLGLVSTDGSITFPYYGTRNAEFLDGLTTVTAVITEATGPDVISKVERAGALPSKD